MFFNNCITCMNLIISLEHCASSVVRQSKKCKKWVDTWRSQYCTFCRSRLCWVKGSASDKQGWRGWPEGASALTPSISTSAPWSVHGQLFDSLVPGSGSSQFLEGDSYLLFVIHETVYLVLVRVPRSWTWAQAVLNRLGMGVGVFTGYKMTGVKSILLNEPGSSGQPKTELLK